MAEYQRFVAYIYEYINGRKSRNAGFAKVESRNGICRIQIHIQDMMPGEGKIEIFCFVRENGTLPAVLLGEGQAQNAVLDRRITTPEETVGGSGYSFDRIGGIWIRSESGRNWATVFDDEPLEIEKLGKTTTDTEQKETECEKGQTGAVQEAPELKRNTSEGKVTAENGEQTAAKVKESAAKMEESAETAEVNQEEAEANSGKNAAGRAETTAGSEKNAAGQGETAGSGKNTAEQEETAAGPEVMEVKPGEIVSEGEEPSERKENSAVEEKKAENTEKVVMKPEKLTETVKETAGEVKASAGRTQQSAERMEEDAGKAAAGAKDSRCAPHTDKRWNCVTARYPHFQPVSDESIEDAIRIQPSDLRTLWQKGWKQGSNSFLMHGFYQYRYLMLGKCRDGGYVLGVPGIYDEQEQYMAKMFGFSEFKPAGGLQEGRRFGYWCRFLD